MELGGQPRTNLDYEVIPKGGDSFFKFFLKKVINRIQPIETMVMDCSSPVAQVPLSPPGPVPVPPAIYVYMYILTAQISPPPHTTPHPYLPVPSISPTVSHSWTQIQVRRILRGPPITHAAWVFCLPHLLQPLPLGALVRYQVREASQRYPGSLQMFWCFGMQWKGLLDVCWCDYVRPVHLFSHPYFLFRSHDHCLTPRHAFVPFHPHQLPRSLRNLPYQPLFNP